MDQIDLVQSDLIFDNKHMFEENKSTNTIITCLLPSEVPSSLHNGFIMHLCFGSKFDAGFELILCKGVQAIDPLLC